MKKLLLSSVVLLGLAANVKAQAPVIIFDGTEEEVANGNPYAFENSPATVKLDTNLSDGNVYLHATGTNASGGYAGGVGVGGYNGTGQLKPLGYTGDVESSVVWLKVRTQSTTPKFQIQFKSDSVNFGYEWNFSDSTVSNNWIQLWVPTSEFKLKNKAGAFDSIAVSDARLQSATSEVQFIISTVGVDETVIVDIDDLIIAPEEPNGLENNALFADAADEVVTVFDMVGTQVAQGKVRDLNLENGKLYIFKSAKGSRKVVIK